MVAAPDFLSLSPRARDLARSAWTAAYVVHLKRAPTEGSGTGEKYAHRLANRVWPLYVREAGSFKW